jgi:hypothetical protein
MAETWSKQREIIEAVRDHPRVAVHSCHEVGKSWIAAATASWWLDTHPVGDARVVTTAPTQPQVEAILWNEINKFHDRAGLGGRTTLTEWRFDKYLAGVGRKPDEYSPAAFQGLHAKYMLVILDEAYGIPKMLWDGASTLAANEFSRTLVIGNPDGPGEFQDVCRPGSGWHVIHVGAADTPNWTGEEVSQDLRDRLIHPSWAEERAIKWGKTSALYQSKVDGVFPKQGDPFACIPYDWLSACRMIELPTFVPVEAGIDVGAGGDRTVIRERRGLRAGRVREFIDSDPVRTAGDLNVTIGEWGIERVKVDSTGIGWALAGALKDASTRHNPSGPGMHHAEIIPVNFGAGPSPGLEKKFLNKRAEIWWGGRERSRPDLVTWDLSTVGDDVIAELAAPRYEILDSFGKIKIEAKKDVIKRIGQSPDHADALLLAFLETITIGEITASRLADMTMGSMSRGRLGRRWG